MSTGLGCDFRTAVKIVTCDGCGEIKAAPGWNAPEGWTRTKATPTRPGEASEFDTCPKCHPCCHAPKSVDEPGVEHECYVPDSADL